MGTGHLPIDEYWFCSWLWKLASLFVGISCSNRNCITQSACMLKSTMALVKFVTFPVRVTYLSTSFSNSTESGGPSMRYRSAKLVVIEESSMYSALPFDRNLIFTRMKFMNRTQSARTFLNLLSFWTA